MSATVIEAAIAPHATGIARMSEQQQRTDLALSFARGGFSVFPV